MAKLIIPEIIGGQTRIIQKLQEQNKKLEHQIRLGTEREKYWQCVAGNMASIANSLDHYIDERNILDNDLEMIQNMRDKYRKFLDFDEME